MMHKILYRTIAAGQLLFAGLAAFGGAYLFGTAAHGWLPEGARIVYMVVFSLCGWLVCGLPCAYLVGKTLRRLRLAWSLFSCPTCGRLRTTGEAHICPPSA